ncbi:MAG: hypothetical protein NZ888_06145 [Candidatus Nitrosocaldus sp.]|nr:hypothetical protein [Candidatus Nitrosocaldus sp.]MDW8000829.1 DNA glycosylase [Candidatus Nitrosocaldus sp.]
MIPIDAIDVQLTLQSGQVFLWYMHGGSYYIIHSENVVRVGACDDNDDEPMYTYESRPEDVDVESLFRLDDDIHAITSSIACRDALIGEAIEAFRGLRIMRQDPFQCMISFICATNTSIARVRYMLEGICRRFGRRVEFNDMIFHTFPSPRALQDASINDLAACGLGYRARFVRQAAHSYPAMDLGSIRGYSYDEMKDVLLSVDGIGNKVADCIMLFALDRLDAFPIDVWITRVIARHYRHLVGMDVGVRLTPGMYRRVSSAMRGYFGTYAGYAQQYLYCYARAYMRNR